MIYKYFPCLNRTKKKEEAREFWFGNNLFNSDKKFCSNFIKTTKYNMINFVPCSLLVQFYRYANIYFLVTAILQSIPVISPLNSFSAWAPLIFVLCLSLLREAIEEVAKYKSDVELNSSKCLIYEKGKFVEKQWMDVMVGNIILVNEMESFPSDIVLIASSHESGLCYIETSSLDGEKNLKPRMAPKETVNCFNIEHPIMRMEGKVQCEAPNPSLFSFQGTLILKDKKILLKAKQLLLRGAVLKNTKWIVGIVVYTGEDTKIIRNANPAKFKQSQIEAKTNYLIFYILLFQIFCCLICALASGIWNGLHMSKHYYLYSPFNAGTEGFLQFFTYFLLNNTMIPISLIVSLEMVKLVQAKLMEKDEDLFSKEKGKGPRVSTSSINEELGQIEYIFSDKTGTLTCNKMEFKLGLIGNELYGDTSVLKSKKDNKERRATYVDRKEGVIYTFEDKKLDTLMKSLSSLNIDLMDNSILFTSKRNKDILYSITTQKELMEEYLMILSTCHECVLDSEKNDGMVRYQGPSPDEITLVDTARHLGYEFAGNSAGCILLQLKNERKEIPLLNLFEFDSDRKRMSVIVRDAGKIKLYIKGADSIILSRLDESDPGKQPFKDNTIRQLDQFSRRGLRTLCLAMKIIEEEEYHVFEGSIMKLAEHPERDIEIGKLADKMERDLILIGATAVEDKLQDRVPETIHDLIDANIKVWMLTGDKMETAENIGRSCNLVQDHFAALKLVYNKGDDMKQKLEELVEITKMHTDQRRQKSFLIEGEHLGIVLANKEFTLLFVDIVKDCEAVICCRVSPKQKADVVSVVKSHLKKITLSIGDGANDVNMIQEAHIGVGLYGQEGVRAVQASDFALHEFKGLWKLVLVHGKWSYIRISEMILYFFYKNMIFTIPQFYFSFVCAFSGQTIFDDWYITFYNLIFTAMPLIVRAIMDQDVYYKIPLPTEEISEDKGKICRELPLIKKYYPKLYYIGQKNTIFQNRKFLLWCFQGIVHGIIVFVFQIYAIGKDSVTKDGYNSDQWLFSISLYTSIILIVDFKLAVYTKYWTLLTMVALLVTSLGFYFAYIWISDQISDFLVFKTAQMLFLSPDFYLTNIICVSIVFGFDCLVAFIKIEWKKSFSDALKILIKREDFYNEKYLKDVGKELIGMEASYAPEEGLDDSENVKIVKGQMGSPG